MVVYCIKQLSIVVHGVIMFSCLLLSEPIYNLRHLRWKKMLVLTTYDVQYVIDASLFAIPAGRRTRI